MTIKINLAPINIGSRMLPQVKNTCLSIAAGCCVAGIVNSKLTPLEKDVVSIENNRQYQLPKNQAVVPRELIGGEEFKAEVDTLKVFWPRTAELLTKFAKKSDEYYDKSYIDTYKIFKQYSRRDGSLILDEDYIPFIIEFSNTDDGISEVLRDKIIDYLRVCPAEYSKTMKNMYPYRACSPNIKEKVLDLNIKVHNEFEDLGLNWREIFNDDFTEALVGYIKPDLSEKELSRRIDILSKIAEYNPEISSFSSLINSVTYVGEEDKALQSSLVQRFLNLNILPTEEAVRLVTTDSIESRENFFELMKPLTDLRAEGVKVDGYIINNILKKNDKTVLNKLIEFIKSNEGYKGSIISLRENSLNPNEYQINFITNKKNKTAKTFIFDKKTHKMTAIQKVEDDKNISTFSTESFKLNRSLEKMRCSSMDLGGTVLDKKVVQRTKNGVPKYTEYTQMSPMVGQYDVYRMMTSGKVKVLGKSFSDPITGEAIVKRKFTSPNGVTVSYNYKAGKSGNSDLSYIIKNKTGDIMMNQKLSQRVLGDNHYLSIVNGKKYEVKLDDHILTLIPEGESPIILDLEDIVKVDNPKIYNTIAQLPPDEILNLKRFKVNIVRSINSDSAKSIGQGFWDEHNIIEIGDALVDSKFVILHELGHIKDKYISDADYEKILKVYRQEVDKIRRTTTKGEQICLSYLIDTDHYLNVNRGAIGELVADTNAQRAVLTDVVLADVGIRTLKAQEYLPETIATISEILNRL